MEEGNTIDFSNGGFAFIPIALWRNRLFLLFSTGVDGEKTWYFFEETILRLAAPYWASGGIPLILKVCIYLYKLVYDVAR